MLWVQVVRIRGSKPVALWYYKVPMLSHCVLNVNRIILVDCSNLIMILVVVVVAAVTVAVAAADVVVAVAVAVAVTVIIKLL